MRCRLTVWISCLLIMANLTIGTPLFSNGESTWSVYVSPDASPTVLYAAEEFINAVERISGARLPRVDSLQQKELVLIGTATDRGFEGSHLGLTGKKDEIAIRTAGERLFLAGNSPRGALYAVYAFLRQEFGVRFLFPGPKGECYPPRQTYSLPTLAINHTPSFPYRGHHLCWRHVDETYETWMARNFLNIMRSGLNAKVNQSRRKKGIHIMVSNHNVNLPKELLKRHPECFAESNGRRHARQLCLSCPLTEKLIYQKMETMLKQAPEIEILSIFPSDNMDYCTCKECRKRSVSTVWFDFYQKLCSRLRKSFPHIQFSTIAYQGYLNVPETSLRDSIFIEYAQHDRCYMHGLGDPSCPSNAFALKRMKQWMNKKIPLGIYAYEFDIMAQENSVMLPFYPILAEGIRWYRNHGFTSVITEAFLDYPPKGGWARNLTHQNAFALYLYAQLLWNADADEELLLEDWNKNAYGKAAPMATQIMRKMATWYAGAKGHIGNFHNSPFGTASKILNPQRIKALMTIIKEGEDILGKQPASQQVRLHKENFDYLKTCMLQWEQAYWFSTQSTMTINIPKVADPTSPFAHAVKLPPLRSKKTNATFYPTEISMSWDADYLNVMAVCHDENMQDIRTECTKRDQQVFNDDCIELFYANPGNTDGLYKHIMVNANGIMMDVSTVGPASYNTAWNPDTLVKTGRLSDNRGWTVELRIPHKANGPAPKAGDSWRGAIMRTVGISRKGLSNSGYPDSSYHDPNSFATFYFNEHTDTSKRLLVLKPEKVQDTNLRNTLLKAGWTASFCSEPKALPLDVEEYDMLLVRLPEGSFHKGLKHRELARDFLQRGGIVVYSSYGNLPLEQYLNNPLLKLEGSTWKTDPLRKNLDFGNDDWWTTPYNLYKLLGRTLAASYGYAGTDGGWRNLVSLKLKDGRIFPWLIARPYDKGLLVVTGSDMGFAGGHVIFGSGKSHTVSMLLENLRANQKKLMQPVRKIP